MKTFLLLAYVSYSRFIYSAYSTSLPKIVLFLRSPDSLLENGIRNKDLGTRNYFMHCTGIVVSTLLIAKTKEQNVCADSYTHVFTVFLHL